MIWSHSSCSKYDHSLRVSEISPKTVAHDYVLDKETCFHIKLKLKPKKRIFCFFLHAVMHLIHCLFEVQNRWFLIKSYTVFYTIKLGFFIDSSLIERVLQFKKISRVDCSLDNWSKVNWLTSYLWPIDNGSHLEQRQSDNTDFNDNNSRIRSSVYTIL